MRFLASAVPRYFYDTHGRMRVEERWVNDSPERVTDSMKIYPVECPTCGCNNQGNIITEDLEFAASSSSSPSAVTQRTDGVAATASGSSGVNSTHPVYPLPGGNRHGNWPIVELVNDGAAFKWHFRQENQLGTLPFMKAALPFR